MNCFRPKRSRTPAATKSLSTTQVKQTTLLRIRECKVHLIDEGEAVELSSGENFELVRISDENVSLATAIKVGDELRWPLTKDEPVVKVDALRYLFSLPIKDDKPLSYAVTFSDENNADLGLLDSFLEENSLFTSCGSSSTRNEDINWKEFAPAVDDYNSVLAKAIAGGTGSIVKGIFKCTNAYTHQVRKGGETILIRAKDTNCATSNDNSRNQATKKNAINKSLKRVRKLSRMTEKMSKTMLDVVGVATTTVMAPVVRSQAGRTILSMVPGEVVLASLDAVNRIIDAAEVAEKQTLKATSGAVTRMVTNRFGENAGEATEDALAAAGHCGGTAWNVFKIRKAFNPASSLSSGILNNATKSRIKP